MAILPFADWMYDLPYRRDEVNQLHAAVLKESNEIQSEIEILNSAVTLLTDLTLTNSMLIITGTTRAIQDEKFTDIPASTDLVLDPVEPNAVISVAEFVLEFSVLSKALKIGVAGLRKAKVFGQEIMKSIKDKVDERLAPAERGVEDSADLLADGPAEGASISAETLGEGVTEAAVEATAEGMTMTAAASIPIIGLMAALGIDAIFSALDGRRQAVELDELIAKLQKSLDKLRKFRAPLARKKQLALHSIFQQEHLLLIILRELKSLNIEQKFSYEYIEVSYQNREAFRKIAASARDTYSPLLVIRETVYRRVKNDPDVTFKALVEDIYEDNDQKIYTRELITSYIHVLSEFSDAVKRVFRNSAMEYIKTSPIPKEN